MSLRRTASRLTVAALLVGLLPIGIGARIAAARTDVRTTDGNITRLTTNILERSQFSHHPFDEAMASRFLDRYLDSLDVTRSTFLQTDVAELAKYRATLADATREEGDTSAARAVFTRYLERMGERTAYVTRVLRSDPFDFTGHDVYSVDREHAERPHDLTAAQQLWREELRAEYLQAKLGGEKPEQIVRTLTHRYEQRLRTMKALTSDEVLEIYLDALTHVYDPHSDYLGHEETESMSIAMNLSLVGIGATLASTDGYCKVRELVPGGPAARGGLLTPGDRIVAVAQAGKDPVDITNMPLSRAVELIRGPKGSPVTLTVLPAGHTEGSPTKLVTIERDLVNLEDQEAKARIVDLPSATGATLRLGVIDLPSFYADMGEHGAHRSATTDVERLLRKLEDEHVRGVVLDLRRNGGGSLGEAISLTGLFIRTGPVVQTRDEAGKVEVAADTDPSIQYDGPLVVLTSRYTASASEILAGALQDYGRALVVGDASTFGKGTVQSVLPLGRVMDRVGLRHAYDPGALKVTTNKFYRPSGASTQLRGVASDIVLPSESDVGEANESALRDALPWDTVAPTPYEDLDRVAPYVSALRDLSARRVAADPQLGYVEEDLRRLKAKLAAKTVSLNEADRRQELTDAKAREEKRDAAAKSVGTQGLTAYPITLRRAAAPGLPLPETLIALPDDPTLAAAGADAEAAEKPSHREDVTLHEAVRILADYVGLLTARL